MGLTPNLHEPAYFAESTVTGTAGDHVKVVLREQLNSPNVYYYTVSAVSGDIIVTLRGSFMTPHVQYTKYYAVNQALFSYSISHYKQFKQS